MALKKITKAIFNNFQGHKYSEVNFTDFVGIIGATGKGKSAIMRGIEWCLYNTPSGTSFIRKGFDISYDEDDNEVLKEKPMKTCFVKIFFSDNTTIKRCRGPKENYYDLTTAEDEIIHLEAFGVGSVPEVVSFHGMREVDLFGQKQSLSICKQLSLPFFLAESAITKAVMVGKLANTDVVDLAIKNNATDIREKKATEKRIKKELTENKDKLKLLKNLSKMERAINSAKTNYEKMNELQLKLTRIDLARTRIITLSTQKELLSIIVARHGEIVELMTIIDEISALQSQLTQMTRITRQLNINIEKNKSLKEMINGIDLDEVNDVIREADVMLDTIHKVSAISSVNKKLVREIAKASDLKKYDIDVSEIDKTIDQLNVCQQTLVDIRRIKSVEERYSNQLDRRNKGERITLELRGKYDASFNTYKKALIDNKTCPTCMSEITEDKIENLKDII